MCAALCVAVCVAVNLYETGGSSALLTRLFLKCTEALYRVCSTGLRQNEDSPSFCLFRLEVQVHS